MTLCSGTEAPAAAITHILGAQNVRHVVACNSWHDAERFGMENHPAEQCFRDISALEKGFGPCCMCNDKRCCSIAEEHDVGVV